MKFITTAAAAMMLMAPSVFANGYLGGQFNYVDAETGSGGVRLPGVSFLTGYQYNDYLGLEARIGVGVGDDSNTANGTKVEYELDYYYGGYLVGTVPLTESFDLYALAGYAKAEATVKANGTSVKGDDSKFSYGGGLKWNANRNWTFSAEYLMLVEDMDSVNVGITYRF
ncbi:porin family protein [Shewanella corallii]|uniref:Porin family protein n=1 Tax=Shewanella corallii TaxID=560080 RepID=A0ABT0NDB6_9GAMM|nr:porin family protein [Shewanella corallii]MCL2916464.1 porin family protein [Shewanella corallii]